MHENTAPRKMTTSKVVEIQQPSYRITGEEVYYFTASLEPNDYTDRFGREVTEWLWQVDETMPIHVEVCYSFDDPKNAGQTALLKRVDETISKQDFRKLVDWLNDELAGDQCSEVDFLPDEKGFEPYYLENEVLVSVHDPALPGGGLVDIVSA